MSSPPLCPPTPPILPTGPTPPPKEVEGSPSSGLGRKRKKSGSKSKKTSSESESEPQCSICLDNLENMSYTDKCFHKFCFTCLLEWSKVKPVCPLCKGRFTSIIHTIKSDDNYESYTLPQPAAAASEDVQGTWGALFMDRFFNIDQALRRVRRETREGAGFILPSLSDDALVSRQNVRPPRHWMRRRVGPSTSDFRQRVYAENLYVDAFSVSDTTGRYRETNPEWYRQNQAQTHRLVPWLNRELNVLLTERLQQSSYVINLIMDVIQTHDITSPEFHDRLLPYLGNRTSHFQHEFFNFARSVYDMVGFDRYAVYAPRQEIIDVGGGSSALAPGPSNVATSAATNNQITTVVISSESDDNSDIEIVDEVFTTRNAPQPSTSASDLASRLATLADHASSLLQRAQEISSFSERDPSNSAASLAGPSNVRTSAEDKDQDGVEIVDVLPPKPLRHYDVIDIFSGEENENPNSPSVISSDSSTASKASAHAHFRKDSKDSNDDSTPRRRGKHRSKKRYKLMRKEGSGYEVSSSESNDEEERFKTRKKNRKVHKKKKDKKKKKSRDRSHSKVRDSSKRLESLNYKGKGKGMGKSSKRSHPSSSHRSSTVTSHNFMDCNFSENSHTNSDLGKVEASEEPDAHKSSTKASEEMCETSLPIKKRLTSLSLSTAKPESHIVDTSPQINMGHHNPSSSSSKRNGRDNWKRRVYLENVSDSGSKGTSHVDDDDVPLASIFDNATASSSRAVKDHTSAYEYEVTKVGNSDLRLKILNKKLAASLKHKYAIPNPSTSSSD